MKKLANRIERDYYQSQLNTSFKETIWHTPSKIQKKTNFHENASDECELASWKDVPG